MAFDDILATGIALANSLTLTGGLQTVVAHAPYTGQNEYAEPTYGAPTNRMAVVSFEERVVRRMDGRDLVASVRLLFLDPAVSIDERDQLTLPSGVSTPIVRVDRGLVRDDGTTFFAQVFCE